MSWPVGKEAKRESEEPLLTGNVPAVRTRHNGFYLPMPDSSVLDVSRGRCGTYDGLCSSGTKWV